MHIVLIALALAGEPAPVAPPESRANEAAAVVAGAAAAGFVGGALIAVPALFSLLPLGVFVAAPLALLALGGGAALGAFVGELPFGRVGTSAVVAGIAASGALVGTTSGALVGGFFGGNDTGLFVGALVGGALGGLVGAASAGGLSSLWLTP
jgi:hypothetical protein